MIYLVAVAVVEWIALVQMVRMPLMLEAGLMSRVMVALTTLGIMVTALLLAAPMLMEIVQIHSLIDGHSISMNDEHMLPLWFMGSGSLIALTSFGYRLWVQSRSHEAGWLAVGQNVMGVMVGVYMMVVVADQLFFYAPHRADAGMLNWSIMKRTKGLENIVCDSDTIVVKGIDSGVATYRCPQNGFMIFERYSGAPIIPWPSYVEGSSAKLASEIKAMQKSAINAGGHQ